MVDPRFHRTAAPMSLADVAVATGADLAPEACDSAMISAVAPLSLARQGDVTMVIHRRLIADFQACAASACFTSPDLAPLLPGSRGILVTPDPRRAFARIAQLLHPVSHPAPEIHPSANIGPGTSIGQDASIGPNAVIGAAAELGDGVKIGPGAFIGDGVVLGARCDIGAHVSLTHSVLGDEVVILSGARVGQTGFGYTVAESGGFMSVPQLGRVLIGDRVHIGANTTIDRGSGEDTVIGSDTKIDNLVQIAHNCRIGRGCLIASQVGLSGSVTLGDFVQMGGKAGVADHLTIGDGARLAAKSGVLADVPKGAVQGGTPAQDLRDWHRDTITLRRLSRRPRSKTS